MDKREPDLETIPVDDQRVDSVLPDRLMGFVDRHMAGVAVGAIGCLALGGLGFIFGADHSGPHSSLARTKTEDTAPPTTIAPNLSAFKPDYGGPGCSSKERTIKPGDTVFGLTTVGLKGDTDFLNEVFGWNLNYLKEQAKKNPKLANPNNIPIGEKFKIETNCLDLQQVYGIRDYDHFKYDSTKPNAQPPISEYKRQVEFQFYHGTDGKTHDLVTIEYVTSANGDPKKVDYCRPVPDCYGYVAGAPPKPPSWQWTP